MMIEKRVRIIPQREEEYFVVGDKEFENESEAQNYVREIRVDDAFNKFNNDVKYYPHGNAYYGSYGIKHVVPTADSLKGWLSANDSVIMNFYNELEGEK